MALNGSGIEVVIELDAAFTAVISGSGGGGVAVPTTPTIPDEDLPPSPTQLRFPGPAVTRSGQHR